MCNPPNYYVPPSNTPVPPPRQVIFQRRVSGGANFGVIRPALTASCDAFENGLICYPMSGTRDGREGDHVLLAPPFIISDDQIGELVDKLEITLNSIIN